MSHLHRVLVRQPTDQLGNLLAWLDKAESCASHVGFEPDTFLGSRLFVDMFPLRRQIQAATDAAKLVAARCAGVEAPFHEDGDASWAEIRARIEEVIAFLGSVDAAALEGVEDRVVTLKLLPEGKGMKALDYAFELGLPNFQFHLTMTYAILRANGVPLGKRDYIRHLSLIDV